MSQMRSCALKKMVTLVPLSREWFGKNNSRQLHTRHHSFFGSNGAGSGRCFGGRQAKIRGLNPGPLLFVEHKDFVWGLIASMYLGNVVALVLVLTTVPIFASILRVPFAAVAPMIVVSCAIGAYAIQNAMFDICLMLGFAVVGYVFKKISIPLVPFTLALVLGNRAEDAFRLSMIGSGADMKMFWSNGLVGSITTLAIVLLFWPVIDRALGNVGRLMRPAKASG